MYADIHVTRRSRPHETGHDIALDEWRVLIAISPDLCARGEGFVGEWWRRPVTADQAIGAIWSADPDGQPIWWEDGRLSAHRPTRALLRRMYGIAMAFEASVMDDDGLHYGQRGLPIGYSAGPVLPAEMGPVRPRLPRRFFA